MIEAIHWRKVDAVIATPGTGLQPSCKANAVFRQRGYAPVSDTGLCKTFL
jgi:hypothetical protein